ncbi:hypothetical protein [Bifidobacterium lemurum]|uniref:hypothetical protein n=1 Tax=Bifidobacterium lemurum TaxID=1603886 RepID=UPI001396673E|nr:hypothetical protein [Bifidobacterium lemurum]
MNRSLCGTCDRGGFVVAEEAEFSVGRRAGAFDRRIGFDEFGMVAVREHVHEGRQVFERIVVDRMRMTISTVRIWFFGRYS